MSNWAQGIPGRRINGARGFKVKIFDVLHNQTWWYSKTYSSLRNVKLAIAHGAFNERQFLDCEYRSCVELFIYDVETWKLAAVCKGDGGTNVVELSDRHQNCTLDNYSRSYWSGRAGEWEDNIKKSEESDDEG